MLLFFFFFFMTDTQSANFPEEWEDLEDLEEWEDLEDSSKHWRRKQQAAHPQKDVILLLISFFIVFNRLTVA